MIDMEYPLSSKADAVNAGPDTLLSFAQGRGNASCSLVTDFLTLAA
jgi:hypothetical protein